jgi:hypothetical protein
MKREVSARFEDRLCVDRNVDVVTNDDAAAIEGRVPTDAEKTIMCRAENSTAV